MADERKVEDPFAERENDRDNIETNKEKVCEGFKEVTFNEEIKVIQADDAGNETTLNQSDFPINESGEGLNDNLKNYDTEDGQTFGNGDKCTKDDQVDDVQKFGDVNLGIKDVQDVQHVRNGDQCTIGDQIDVQDVGNGNIKDDHVNEKTVNSDQGTKYDQVDVQSTGNGGQLTKDDQEDVQNVGIDNQGGTIAHRVLNGKNAGNDDQSTKDVKVNRQNVGNCDQGGEPVLIKRISQEQEDEQSKIEQKNTNAVKFENGDVLYDKEIEHNDLNYTGIKKTILKRKEEQTMDGTEKKDLGLDTENKFGNSIKIHNGTKQPSDNIKLSDEHIEENMDREVTPRERILNATDDNDSGHGHEDGMVDFESDEHAEVHDDVDDDDGDIEELQKLIEEHHLTKCDSEAELSNKGNRMLLDQEDQLEKPYYDKVPPISASNRPGQRLTPNRALIAQIPTSSVKWNLSDGGRISTRQSGRLPPNVIKMSTVMLSAKKRRTAVVRSMSQYYEDKKHAKLLRWDECVNSRPPLPIDLDLPGPWHYSPNNKPPNETNAPEYSFGMKFYERGGGARTAHAKTWFNSTSNFTTKVNFEKRWPSPAQYSSKPLLGRRHHTLPDFPVYTIGVRSNFVINKKGSEYEPSPNEYYPHRSIALTLPNAPAYTFGSRHTGTCTSIRNTDPNNPGPGNYTPRIQFMSTKRHRPSFTIKGVRVPKSHMLGPHATL